MLSLSYFSFFIFSTSVTSGPTINRHSQKISRCLDTHRCVLLNPDDALFPFKKNRFQVLRWKEQLKVFIVVIVCFAGFLFCFFPSLSGVKTIEKWSTGSSRVQWNSKKHSNFYFYLSWCCQRELVFLKMKSLTEPVLPDNPHCPAESHISWRYNNYPKDFHLELLRRYWAYIWEGLCLLTVGLLSFVVV